MKTNYLMGLALAGLGLVSGCIIYSGSGECRQPPSPQPPGPMPPHDTVIAEIEAVCRLVSEADRHDLLVRIAGRPNLSPAAQARLAKVASDRLVAEANRKDVLLTLANNPSLHDEGVRAILAAIDSLVSESSRREVLDAIGRRQARPPIPGPAPGPEPAR